MTILLLAAGLQAFSQLDGVATFSYWRTGHAFETGSGPRSDSRFISFNRPFAFNPRIVLSIKLLDASNGANLRIDTNFSNVSRSGFLLSVNTWADTKIYAISVFWIAYTS